jgi:hypothetical protein
MFELVWARIAWIQVAHRGWPCSGLELLLGGVHGARSMVYRGLVHHGLKAWSVIDWGVRTMHWAYVGQKGEEGANLSIHKVLDAGPQRAH